MDFAEAEAALESAFQQDAAGTSGSEQAAPSTPATPEAGTQPQGTTPPAPEADSFTKLDPNALPPEAKPFYDSMLADYRRKTQEIAETRRSFESLGDLETAQQALEFVSAFEADPLSVYERIQNYLTEEGLLEAQAAAAAAAARPEDAYSGYEEEDDPVSPLAQRLEQVERALVQQEQERINLENANRLHAQVMNVREAHPDWNDDDLGDVLRLAFSTGGDVLAAADLYDGLTQRRLSAYIEQKQAVTPPAPAPASTASGSDVPPSLDSLEMGHRAAVEHLENILAQGG